MSRVNGVETATSEALHALADRACRALETRDAAHVFAMVCAMTDVPVDVVHTDEGGRWMFPAEAFPTAADFARELRERTKRARLAAFPVLAAVANDEASALFLEGARLNLINAQVGSIEADLTRSLWARWKELHVPESFYGELYLRGTFAMKALTDAQLAAIPYDTLVEALVANRLPYPDFGEAERLLRVRGELHDLESKAALAAQLAAANTRHLGEEVFEALMDELVAQAHPSAAPAAVAFAKRVGPTPRAVGYIVAAHHVSTLKKWFAELVPRKLAWDPHHVDAEHAHAIRAGFALDPATASQRFAPFFTAKAVRSDAGAKIAHDIWLVGFGTIVDHDGTRLGTDEGDLLSRDPGWGPIAVELVKHARLGKIARSIVSRWKAPGTKTLKENAPPKVKSTTKKSTKKPTTTKSTTKKSTTTKSTSKKSTTKKSTKKPRTTKSTTKKSTTKPTTKRSTRK